MSSRQRRRPSRSRRRSSLTRSASSLISAKRSRQSRRPKFKRPTSTVWKNCSRLITPPSDLPENGGLSPSARLGPVGYSPAEIDSCDLSETANERTGREPDNPLGEPTPLLGAGGLRKRGGPGEGRPRGRTNPWGPARSRPGAPPPTPRPAANTLPPPRPPPPPTAPPVPPFFSPTPASSCANCSRRLRA